MSDIKGNGYGSSHDWKLVETPQDNSKRTFYQCKDCKTKFTHHYDDIPDIFDSMYQSNIIDKCPFYF